MGYTRQNWANGASGGTPIDANRLNYIEAGIANSVAKGELVLNIADPKYGANPTTSDLAANSEAINQAMADAVAGGGAVFVPPFTFPSNGISSLASSLTMYGAGRNLSKITSATGDVLTLAGGSVMLKNIGFTSLGGGGHTVAVPAGSSLSQSKITGCNFTQQNDGKSVWHFDDPDGIGGGFFDVHWSDIDFEHTTTATVPGFYVNSQSKNVFSANRFHRSRAHSSGAAQFFTISIQSNSGSWNMGNTWEDINFEVCNGGGILLLGALGTNLLGIRFFDCSGTLPNNMIEIGRVTGSAQTRGTTFVGYHRTSGTLASGKADIAMQPGNTAGITVMQGITGPASVGVTVDCGNGPAALLGVDDSVTVINTASAAILSGRGFTAPKLTPGSYTNTALNSATNIVNTNGKGPGTMVWNSSVNRPVYAKGPAATDLWLFGDGTTANTPV